AAAHKFNIPVVFNSLKEAVQQNPAAVVFDVAVPGTELLKVLHQLPAAATVLMQKPMGVDYNEAKQILQYTQHQQMIAGVNFQLRYAPFIKAARELMQHGLLGEL